MKIAVLADIHGNLPALKAVMAEIELENVNQILVAGDILGGPYPVEVIDILNNLNACMIKGNFEEYILKIYSNPEDSDWYTSKQWSSTYWVYKCLNQYWLSFIDTLPKQRVISINETENILMVHKIYHSRLSTDATGVLVTDIYNEVVNSYTKSIKESVLIFAHNHIPWIQKINGCLALNPGSIGFPLNGTIGAQYAIMEWNKNQWNLDIRTVKYNIDEINTAFFETGYLKEGGVFARLVLYSINTGKDIVGMFFKLLTQLAYKEGYSDFEVIPDKLLELAEKQWDWNKFTSNKKNIKKEFVNISGDLK